MLMNSQIDKVEKKLPNNNSLYRINILFLYFVIDEPRGKVYSTYCI